MKAVKPEAWFFLEAYNHYKNGYLPNGGGWLEQPMKVMEAIKALERIITKRAKKNRAKNG